MVQKKIYHTVPDGRRTLIADSLREYIAEIKTDNQQLKADLW